MKTTFSNAFLYAVSQDPIVDALYSMGEIKVLLACESGSRAWGFASPDSDFDIRFVYARPKDWYISLAKPRDVINFTFTREGTTMDVVGWDIKKYLGLLGKGNAQAYEWLHCPPYHRDPVWYMELSELAVKFLDRRALGDHYRGLARQHYYKYVQNKVMVPCKKYLYLFRSLYSLQWVVTRQGLPPINFIHLIDSEAPGHIHGHIADLLNTKKSGGEDIEVDRDPDIDSYIVGKIDTLTESLHDMYATAHGSQEKWVELEKFLLRTVNNY